MFDKYGYELCEIVPEPSACNRCKSIADSGPFKVKEVIVGDTAPPLHPHCHCSLAPKVDDEKLNQLFEKYEKN